MSLTKLKTAAAVVLVVASLPGGAGLTYHGLGCAERMALP